MIFSLAEILIEAWRAFCGSPLSRHRQRVALRALDDRLLSDIGLSRFEMEFGRRLGPKGEEMGVRSAALPKPRAPLFLSGEKR